MSDEPAMKLGKTVNDLLTRVLLSERRIDPYIRRPFDAVFQRPLVRMVQMLINWRRPDLELGIAEERTLPDEAEISEGIIAAMSQFMRTTYQPGAAERAGNTKTHGVIRGELTVLTDLPERLRVVIFAQPGRSYRTWVRFAGSGPLSTPDLDDTGSLSIGVKLMGVEGPKLLGDEQWTQDFTGISVPTMTTPDARTNLALQRRLGQGVPIFYFLDPRDSHLLDAIMQGLFARTHVNPLEVSYYSCVAYAFGDRQAIHYQFKPRSRERTPFPRRPSPNYLREAMAATLSRHDVELDVLVQFQVDAHRMPIEDASVEWPERLSPFVPVARLRLPAQSFTSPEQLAFACNLSFNPWHSIAAHRPLGNQNRARKTIYLELSKLRQAMNGDQRIEPTGDEVFPQAS
jgi:hypothetical protein